MPDKKYNRLLHLLMMSFVFHFLPVAATLAESGRLRGTIIDGETHLPLENVNVRVVELGRYQSTDTLGQFTFMEINVGLYTIEASRIGYRTSRISVNLDRPAEINTSIIHLYPIPVQSAGIIITGEHIDSRMHEVEEISSVLHGQELQRDMGFTLASTLRNEAGLAIRSMGPAPARPLIRGLGGDRILISEDGNKTNDLSATSPDHAVTVEPFTVERIEVLRGPKILLRSPATIGGIVNIIRDDIPRARPEKLYGNAGIYAETADEGYLGSLTVNVPWHSIVARGEISRKQIGDIRTPLGQLKNSDARTTNYSGGLSYIGTWGYIGGVIREYMSDYGVPGGVVGAHPNGVDISLFRRHTGLRMEYLITHSVMENIQFDFFRTYYRHKEFEYGGILGAEFAITNYTGRIQANHGSVGPFRKGSFGAAMETRDFKVGGFVFTPATKSYNIAAYVYETIMEHDFELELAVRLNYDHINPLTDNPGAGIGNIRDRKFLTYSLALSGLYEIAHGMFVGATASRSSRTPTIEELYSEGPHLAAYSYEVGNPDLGDESGIGLELFSYYKTPSMFFMVTGFRNDLSHYITSINTGKINYTTLLPLYASRSISALFYGIESQLEWKLLPIITFTASVSYTHGSLKESDLPLPAIPPLKGIIELYYHTRSFSVGIGSEYAAAQDRVAEFEESTAGYVSHNAFIQYNLAAGRIIHTFTINAENIFDTVYRNHLSRLKSIVPEPGRDFRLLYQLYF